MGIHFKDYFSGHARDYVQYRPPYPPELFSYLATLTTNHRLAWDCATGNGQAAVSLTGYYKKVIATDASAEQIEQSPDIDGVVYRCATAENSLLEDKSVDLITVAQALHWFDLSAFVREVKRILVDDGILAVWTYGLMHINDDIDEQISVLYSDVLGPYWPIERRMVENSYADVDLPLVIIEPPEFELSLNWDLMQVIGYLNTWSAVKRYETDQGASPVELIVPKLKKLWGDAGRKYQISWPLGVRVWCNDKTKPE